MREFVARWKGMFIRMGAMPVSFLGVGLYRAWLATFFRYEAFPTIDFFDYALFEGAIGVVSFAVVLLSRRITPLWSNNALVTLTAIGIVGGSALCVVSCFWLQVAALQIRRPHVGGSGAGIAHPHVDRILRIAESYARSGVLMLAPSCWGKRSKRLFGGLDPAYIAVFSVMLPLASIDWVRRSMKRLPDVDLPKRMGKAGLSEAPWKPMLLMGVCTFARQGSACCQDQPLVVGNVVGTVLVAAFVIFGVLSSSRWFNFDTIYQLAFPFMTVGLLLIAPQFSLDAQTVATCYDAGYTMLSIFIMIVLSNITYRFGISAAWLNGIERGIRYLVEAGGWSLFAFGSSYLPGEFMNMLHIGIVASVVVAFVSAFSPKKGFPRSGASISRGILERMTCFRRGCWPCAYPIFRANAVSARVKKRFSNCLRGRGRRRRSRRTCLWRAVR